MGAPAGHRYWLAVTTSWLVLLPMFFATVTVTQPAKKTNLVGCPRLATFGMDPRISWKKISTHGASPFERLPKFVLKSTWQKELNLFRTSDHLLSSPICFWSLNKIMFRSFPLYFHSLLFVKKDPTSPPAAPRPNPASRTSTSQEAPPRQRPSGRRPRIPWPRPAPSLESHGPLG